MNKQIRELMAQAGFDPAAIERMGVMPQAEKFAELIVKECLSVIEEMNPHDPERNIDDMFDEVYDHFGVK